MTLNTENKETIELVITSQEKHHEVSFEDALSLTGVGKYTYTAFAACMFSFFCASTELFSSSIITASAQCDLELDVFRLGLARSMPMLGIVASAHLWGYIADTRGRKVCLTVTMTGNFVFAFLASFSHHWIVLAVLKCLSTACSSGTQSVAFTQLGEQMPMSLRPRFMQFVGTAMICQTFTVLCLYLIQFLDVDIMIPVLNLHYNFWRILAQVLALFNLANVVILNIWVHESPKYYFAAGMDDEGMEVLKKMYAENSGNSAHDYLPKKVVLGEAVKSSKEPINIFVSIWRQTTPLFHRQYIKSTFLVSYLSIVVYSLTTPFIIWLPFVLASYSEDLGTTKSFCQLIQVNKTQHATECNDVMSDFSIFSIGVAAIFYALATILSAFIIKYTGPKRMLIWVFIISSALLALVDNIPNVAASFVFMIAQSALVLMGVCAAYAVQLFPTSVRAMAVCLTIMIGRAFSFISINLIGTQLQNNCSNFMYMAAAFMFSGAVVGLFLPESKKQQTQKNT